MSIETWLQNYRSKLTIEPNKTIIAKETKTTTTTTTTTTTKKKKNACLDILLFPVSYRWKFWSQVAPEYVYCFCTLWWIPGSTSRSLGSNTSHCDLGCTWNTSFPFCYSILSNIRNLYSSSSNCTPPCNAEHVLVYIWLVYHWHLFLYHYLSREGHLVAVSCGAAGCVCFPMCLSRQRVATFFSSYLCMTDYYQQIKMEWRLFQCQADVSPEVVEFVMASVILSSCWDM